MLLAVASEYRLNGQPALPVNTQATPLWAFLARQAQSQLDIIVSIELLNTSFNDIFLS
jgi:hypothetical protein